MRQRSPSPAKRCSSKNRDRHSRIAQPSQANPPYFLTYSSRTSQVVHQVTALATPSPGNAAWPIACLGQLLTHVRAAFGHMPPRPRRLDLARQKGLEVDRLSSRCTGLRQGEPQPRHRAPVQATLPASSTSKATPRYATSAAEARAAMVIAWPTRRARSGTLAHTGSHTRPIAAETPGPHPRSKTHKPGHTRPRVEVPRPGKTHSTHWPQTPGPADDSIHFAAGSPCPRLHGQPIKVNRSPAESTRD